MLTALLSTFVSQLISKPSLHCLVTISILTVFRETGNPKGFGYVTFGSIDEAKAAFEAMTGAEIAGRPVRLDYATPRPERSEGGGRGG